MNKIMAVILATVLIFPLTVDVQAQIEEAGASASILRNVYLDRGERLQPKVDTSRFSDFLKEVNRPRDDYRNFPTNKMGIGVINATTSWTDIPREVSRVSQEENIVSGMTLGFGEGVVSTVKRGSAGAIDVATFGLPPYDEPLLEPEYKVKNPDEEGFRIQLMKW
jgi:putative exosortase-associated protein (TIGR04073 family)